MARLATILKPAASWLCEAQTTDVCAHIGRDSEFRDINALLRGVDIQSDTCGGITT
jgi:hypothetical protein